MVVHRLVAVVLTYVNDCGISITKYSEFLISNPLNVFIVARSCTFWFSRAGWVSTATLMVWMLLGSIFMIELIVSVCTPYPDEVRLVILKSDEVLVVLASTMELTTNLYCVLPVVSVRAALDVIVAVVPEEEQVAGMD